MNLSVTNGAIAAIVDFEKNDHSTSYLSLLGSPGVAGRLIKFHRKLQCARGNLRNDPISVQTQRGSSITGRSLSMDHSFPQYVRFYSVVGLVSSKPPKCTQS